MNFAMYYTLNIVSTIFKQLRLRTSPGKFFMGSWNWKVLEKSWIFASKRAGTLVLAWYTDGTPRILLCTCQKIMCCRWNLSAGRRRFSL